MLEKKEVQNEGADVALIKDKKLWRHIINYIPLD